MVSDQDDVPMTPEQKEKWQKAMVWVIGVLDKFREMDLVEGGEARLSPKGRVMYERLLADGYEPTKEEIDAVMDSLMRGEDSAAFREREEEERASRGT